MQCQPGTHIDQGTAPGLTSYLRPHHPHPPSPATHRFFRGGIFFGDLPDAFTLSGAGIIVAAGLYIFWREEMRGGSERAPPLHP